MEGYGTSHTMESTTLKNETRSVSFSTCSAEYKGEALIKHLLQGPDLTNKLVGVLSRFRQELVASMAGIEAMFLQVHVTECYRDLLRFMWWENGNLDQQPSTYRMTVHLFGAGSSPGCCNFALKTTAEDYEKELGSEQPEFLRRDFYVDDGLKSVATARDAKKLISKTKQMCHRGGFNLHKFTSKLVYQVRLLQVPYFSAGSPFDSARNPFHSRHRL